MDLVEYGSQLRLIWWYAIIKTKVIGWQSSQPVISDEGESSILL